MNTIHVYDTFATTEKGRIMHFDVVIPTQDPAHALACAQAWLKEIGEENATVKAENCCYCHSEQATPPDMARDLETQGYAIYKLEGCPR